MKSISFARIKLDGHHVQGLGYALEDAQVAATLQQRGVNAKIYAGASEGRVLDLVRQLVRMRTEAFSFHVEPYSLAPTLQLIKGIKALVPAATVYVSGEIGGANEELAAELAALSQHLCARDPLQLSNGLYADGGAPAACASPYQSGLLRRDDVGAAGLAASPAGELAAELDWLAGSGGGVQRIPVLAAREDADGLAATLRALAEHGRHNTYVLFADAAALTAPVFALCDPALIVQIVLSGAPMAAGWQDGFGGDARLVDQTARQLEQRADLYGRNGNVAFHTGNYFDQKQLAGIYHLEVPSALAASERRRVYRWSSSDMDIRSAVVLRTSEQEFAERLPQLAAPQTRETGGWPKHAYAIVSPQPQARAAQAQLQLDGRASAQPMGYISLADLAGAALTPGVQHFIRIGTPADVAELVARLERFHGSGEIDAAHPSLSVIVENRCRWTAAGNCRVQLLRRVSVDTALRLSTCGDTAPVGEVGMPFEQLVSNVKRQQQLEQVRRDCAGCEVRDACSQCSQLPLDWAGQYCAIRKRFPQTALYFEMLNFPAVIAPLLADAHGATVTLGLSFSGLAPRYYRGETAAPRSAAGSAGRPIIIEVGNQHIVWWKGQRKLIRISRALAVVAEGWWLGADEDQLAACLAATFGVDADAAAASVGQAQAQLRQQGVIHD